MVIAGGGSSPRRADDPGRRVTADVTIDGEVAGRLVATGPAARTPAVAAAIASLAVALAELATEVRARGDMERALQGLRSSVAASALGVDATELAKGRRQQRSIVSLVPPDVPGYDLASHYAAAREIGGDFFELFHLARRGRSLGVVIADVTGKGLDAALLMAFSRPVMHSALNAARGPAEALERTNRVLVDERRGTLFITAACAVLEPRTGRVRLAIAGHEPPLLIPADGGPIRPVGDPGVLLGAFASLGAGEIGVRLARGDVLLFYTDGVTDARSPSRTRFGDARLLSTIEAARGGSAHDVVAAIRSEVETFQGTEEPADDLTMVAIGRHRLSRARR
jgi:sigma-B regulation protein RsbU (phosphoserine phosphatase)